MSFIPSASIAHEFDQATRDSLAESLIHIADAVSEHLSLPLDLLDPLITLIRTETVLPETYAAYYQLVAAIQANQLKYAESLFTEILHSKSCANTLEVIPYLASDQDMRSRHYISQIDTDPYNPFNIRQATEADFEAGKTLIGDALALLKVAVPELHDEILALIKKIMLGSGPKETGAYTFNGASAPGIWGAIVLNIDEAKDVVDMAQTLAHESCHNLLFGYALDDELTLNPDSERYGSPLRSDPRPIEGIYHATFVLARMHYAVASIIDSPNLPPLLKEKAQRELLARETNFNDGLATLKKHANYTEKGALLIDTAEAYMAEYCR